MSTISCFLRLFLVSLSVLFLLIAPKAYSASISGAVFGPENAQMDTYGTVTAFYANGAEVKRVSVDDQGGFSFSDLAPGEYYLLASGFKGYVTGLYDGIECQGACDALSGTVVAVAEGDVIENINFSLAKFGGFRGKAVDATTGEPVAGVEVRVTDENGYYVTRKVTDANGEYQVSGVQDGEYFLVFTPKDELLNELYGGQHCLGNCSPLDGTAVVVANRGFTNDINVELDKGESIIGTVTSVFDGKAVEGVFVSLFNSQRHSIKSASTGVEGKYEISNLPAGHYYLVTSSSYLDDRYQNEVYDGVECEYSCYSDITDGTLVAVEMGATTSNIDFSLEQLGIVSGTITDSETGNPISSVRVSVHRQNGTQVASGVSDTEGKYQVFGIKTGEYYLKTTSSSQYVSELYGDVLCEQSCEFSEGTLVSVANNQVSADKDFTLDQGGKITGVITDAVSGDPLRHVEVTAYDSSGRYLKRDTTDAEGSYELSGLVTGSYYLSARVYDEKYSQELYGGIPCPRECDVTQGVAVAVTINETKESVNFALEHLGYISGKIADAATGGGVSSSRVSVYDSRGTQVSSAHSNSEGEYVTRGLYDGDYYLATTHSNGYVNQLYQGIDCQSYCDPTTGTKVTIANGAIVTDIGFSVQKKGSITGKVVSAQGDAIPGALIRVYNSEGSYVSSASSNSEGHYQTSGLNHGDYYLLTDYVSGYLREVYDDVQCLPTCDSSEGTAVSVSNNTITSGIDFELIAGSSVKGTVKNEISSEGLGQVLVSLYDLNGEWAASDWSSYDGSYEIIGLAAGNYYLKTSSKKGYQHELYSDVPCVDSCANDGGTLVAVDEGEEVVIDVALKPLGTIAGTVISRMTGIGINNAWVHFYDNQGEGIGTVYTDYAGRFETPPLNSGDYLLKVSRSNKFVPQVYGGDQCLPDCEITSGTTISVSVGTVTRGIDINIDQYATVSGRVASPLGGETVDHFSILVYDAEGTFVKHGYMTSDGHYLVSGLVDGDYFLKASSWMYVDQLYGGVTCEEQCDVTTGERLSVSLNSITENIDFVLEKYGEISGKVLDGGSGQGISSAQLVLYDSNGTQYRSVPTNAQGEYKLSGLTSGQYYLSTSNWEGYVNQLYDGTECVSYCDPTDGTPIEVVNNTTVSGIDFSLNKLGSIQGRVSDSASGEGISNVTIRILGLSGEYVATAQSDSSGNYHTSGLPSGSYYLKIDYAERHLKELYGGAQCVPECELEDGEVVHVSLNSEATDINFELDEGGVVEGRISSLSDNRSLSNVMVSVYDSLGEWLGSDWSDGDGRYLVAALPQGNYFIVASAEGVGFQSEVYDDRSCIDGCDMALGKPVHVSLATQTSGIDFALEELGFVSGRLTDVSTGEALWGRVSVYDIQGRLVASAASDASGNYRTGPLPNGSYYVKAVSLPGYVSQIYGFGECHFNCDFSLGSPVTVQANSEVSGINLAFGQGGGISGSVYSADGSLAYHVYVSVYDVNGMLVDQAGVFSSGSYSLQGLVPGDYYLTTVRYDSLRVMYGGGVCFPGCDVTTGSKVSISRGQTVSGIDLTLVARVDSDEDMLPDRFELAYGLDPNDPSDASDDKDGDGVSNVFEYFNGTDVGKDSVPPIFEFLFTSYVPIYADLEDPEYIPWAHDEIDGDAEVSLLRDVTLKPGENLVTWRASDSHGNTRTAQQTIVAVPTVNLAQDQIAVEGNEVIVNVSLSYRLPGMPVKVPFEISGTSSSPEDHNAVSGVITFGLGTESSIVFDVHEDGDDLELDETVVLTLKDPENAILGSKSSHTVTITNKNVHHTVSLVASQGNEKRRLMVVQGGMVTVSAKVGDKNSNDTYHYDWSLSDNALVNSSTDDHLFTFDPSGLISGMYRVSVVVTDQHGVAVQRKLALKVVSSMPVLSSSQDSDGDGVSDADEGLRDTDGDGVPNYLDAVFSRTAQPTQKSNGRSHMMYTNPGLALSIGDTAFLGGSAFVQISEADVIANGSASGGAVNRDEAFDYLSGLHDFVISGLASVGDVASVVIPLADVIPEEALYRKFIPDIGWQDFTVDDYNSVLSAAGNNGYCPPPGDSRYQAGLKAGDACIELRIQDGGPNDADGIANGVVRDPSGIATAASPQASANPEPAPSPLPVASPAGGGGGISWWPELFLCYMLFMIRYARIRGVRAR